MLKYSESHRCVGRQVPVGYEKVRLLTTCIVLWRLARVSGAVVTPSEKIIVFYVLIKVTLNYCSFVTLLFVFLAKLGVGSSYLFITLRKLRFWIQTALSFCVLYCPFSFFLYMKVYS